VYAVLLLGLIARVVLALTTGTNGDIQHGHQLGVILLHHPLSAYSSQRLAIYPYPPGYFGVVALTQWLANATSIPFQTLERLPVIAADLATAWIVARWLADRGERPRRCIAGAALIALNPLSVVIAGYHGQLDQVSTFLAVAGLWSWTRLPVSRRGYVAGALIGLAAAVKPAPAVVIVSLLVVCTGLREAARLLLPFVAVLLGSLAPWLIASWTATTTVLRYQGLPGIGGLSIVVQPRSATLWLSGAVPHANAALTFLERHVDTITLIALAVATLVVAVRRPSPETGGLMMLLPLYAVGVNLSVHYTVWMLPLLILVAPRIAAAVATALLIPGIFVYWPFMRGELASTASPWSPALVESLYIPVVLGLMLAAAVGFVAMSFRSADDRHSLTA
jgi:hypothetical protein